jgi:glycosyltransferase involved in cell wall biosynthesis
MMPLVSIITPVYNASHWLPATIASVRAQTLTDWEQILVDDGSTDDSAAIVEAAARQDSRFRLLRAPCNGGPVSARNMALDAARGKFIAFLDADDLWLPEKLAHSVEWMTEHGYDFIYHDYRHISYDNSRVGRVVRGSDTLTMRSLHTHRGTGCLTVVLDRDAIPALRFPTIAPHHAEDFALWTQLLRKGHTGHRFPCDLARYRLSPQSRSGNKLSSALNAWHLYRMFSKLSLVRAGFWWIQYAWNACWLHYYARPR